MDDGTLEDEFNSIIQGDSTQRMAESAWNLYQKYQLAGFTKAEAFELVKAYVSCAVMTVTQHLGAATDGE